MKVAYRTAIMNVPVLYIVRHGATGDDDAFNSPVDGPLDEKGREDSQEAAKWFHGKKIGDLLASNRKRAMQTAEIIGKGNDREPQVVPALDSLNVGDVANMKSDEEADKVIQHHQKNVEEKIPGGESISDFRNRVQPQFDQAIERYFQTGKPDVMSAHHSVQYEAGNYFNGDLNSAITKPGGVTAVMWTAPGKFKAVPVFKPEGKDNG